MCAATKDLTETLEGLGLSVTRLDELSGDVSPRRYFRATLRDGERCIVALYPSAMRDTQERFVTTTRLLEAADVRVPEILANSPAEGVMVVEDFGGRALFRDGEYPGNEYLFKAAAIAQRIAAIAPEALSELLPPLDGSLLEAELEQTWTMALEPHGLSRESPLGQRLDEALKEVCRRLDDPPLRRKRPGAHHQVPVSAAR